MCGWPAGVGYPPADGELDLAAGNVSTPDTDASEDADHVGVQLDALAGMVARQGEPLAADSSSTDPTESTEAAPSDVADGSDVPTLAVEAADEAAPPEDDQAADASVALDPLTAPLTALTGTSAGTEPTLLEPDAPGAELTTGPDDQTGVVDVPGAVAEEATAGETQTAGRAAALLRPAQLLIVGAAALTLILVGFDAVLGTATGSMTMVVLGLALITLAVWTGAAVTFLHWVSRAHTHVTATASAPQRHGASMSLIGWFIPVAGFVIGYRVLQDLWTGSDPATRNDADAAPAKVRMIDAWLIGIVTAVLFGYAMPLALGESALWGAIGAIGLLVAALSLVSVMEAISTWQTVDSAADAGASHPEPGGDSEIIETDAPSEAAPAPQPVTVSTE